MSHKTEQSDPTAADIVRSIRAFILMCLAEDAVALRPNRPRVRGPITPTAQNLLRTLVCCFENVLTGLCMPSIATLAGQAGCSESQTKELLPALYRTEYLSRKHGKRKRVLTRKGWRVVKSANRYRILCPLRHLAALRRALLKAFGGNCGPLIHKLIARYTPPTEQERATVEIVETLAADLRASPTRSPAATGINPPPRAPPTPEGPVEVGGVRVEDPKLGSVLAGLWDALEKRRD